MARPDGRHTDEHRQVEILTGIQKDPAGSVQISFGQTRVLVAASISDKVPGWLEGRGSGWVTAEYSMLPGAVPGRGRRGSGGRAKEIQRLIGRALRASVDMQALGERLITLDCDVIQADGGTRVASITGGWIALSLAVDKLRKEGLLENDPMLEPVLAVSCVKLGDTIVLDPCYDEDHIADVDANLVLTHSGKLVELQATAEGAPFEDRDVVEMLRLARLGVSKLAPMQLQAARVQK